MNDQLKFYTYPEFYLKLYSNFDADAKKINEFVNSCPDGNILEIGGGSGRTLGFFNSKKHILIESDPEMIKILNLKLSAYKNKELLQGVCPSINLENDSMAGVFAAFGTVGEINPICALLKEIERVLIPGGYALISSLNPQKYPLQTDGIKRAQVFNVSDLSFVANTLPVPSLGTDEYQTHILIRQKGFTQNFIIKQYFPNLDKWIRLINQSGLQLTNNLRDLKKENVFNIVLHKPIKNKTSDTNNIDIANIYDSIAKDYDKFVSNSDYGVSSWLRPKVEPYINLNPKILDLACGNGFIGKLFREIGLEPNELYGYDISKEMVNECTKGHLYNHVCKFDLSLGLPGHPALSIDLITSFGLMEFLNSEEHLISDIFRVLTIGGVLFCSFEALEQDSRDTPVDEDFLEIRHKNKIIKRHRRSKKSILKLFSKAGFSNIQIEKSKGYKSPTTGNTINYYYVQAIKGQI